MILYGEIKVMRYRICVYLVSFMLIACNDDKELIVGQIRSHSPISSLYYQTPTQSGLTNEEGEFYYQEGEMITFYVTQLIPDLALPHIPATSHISPRSWYDSYKEPNILLNIHTLFTTLNIHPPSTDVIQLATLDHNSSLTDSIPSLNVNQTPSAFESSETVSTLLSLTASQTGQTQLSSTTNADLIFTASISDQSNRYEPNDGIQHVTLLEDFHLWAINQDTLDDTYVLAPNTETVTDTQTLNDPRTLTKTDLGENNLIHYIYDLSSLTANTQYNIENQEQTDTLLSFTTDSQASKGELISATTPVKTTSSDISDTYYSLFDLPFIEKEALEFIFYNLANPNIDNTIYTSTISYYTSLPTGEKVEVDAFIAYPTSTTLSQSDIKVFSYQRYTGEDVTASTSIGQLLTSIVASHGYFAIVPFELDYDDSEEITPAYLIEATSNNIYIDALTAFEAFYNQTYSDNTMLDTTSAPLTLFGYSLGGFAATSLMFDLLSQSYTNIDAVWIGEGPYNIESTIAGTISEFLDNDNSDYLDYTQYISVSDQASFLQDYILPSFRAYYNLALDDSDVFDETGDALTLSTDFASNYAYGTDYDTLKSLGFLNSLTSLSSINTQDSSLQPFMKNNNIDFPIYLYHNDEDAIVPIGNANDLMSLLDSTVVNNIGYNRQNCESINYLTFQVVESLLLELYALDSTGSHLLCMLYMLDDILGSFD